MDIFNLKGRVIIITGGTGQLGRQFTVSLLERGAKVAVFDISDDHQALYDLIDPSLLENFLFKKVNIIEKQSVRDGLEHVISKWQCPHGLINSAALDSPPDAPAEENGPFESYPEESFDQVMKINVKGPFLCSQIIGEKMAAEKRGSIINISSIYGLVSPDQRIYEYRQKEGKPFYKPIAYSVSKSALFNMTKYVATYWAKDNIRSNTLTFGGVFNNQDKDFLKGYCARVPLGRMAKEDEYCGAVIFLLSDASSYMTGANLVIDGGWTSW